MPGTETVTLKLTKKPAVKLSDNTPLHVYWVPCAIARFASVKSSLWIKHLYVLRHLTTCYCT